MIKQAQIRFITITMSIVLVIFIILFAGIFSIIGTSHTRVILYSLNSAITSYERGDHIESEKTLFLVFEGNMSDRNYTIVNGGSFYSDEQISDILDLAQTHSDGSGSLGKIFGKIFFLHSESHGKTVLVARDTTYESDKLNTAVIRTLLVLLILYFVLAIIVIGASFTIFDPIKENLKRQRQFISDASHELRTPITIISANTEVLKTITDSNYLESIKHQTKRLETLVADMLVLNKVDENRLQLKKEEFSLSDEVNEATLPYEAVLFENGKTLVTDVDENLLYTGDRQSFKTILGILIDNAVRHSADHAVIKVSLKKEAAKTVLTVFNTGSKIHDADSNKIFGRFYRGDESRSRDSGGSGLGLAIAKDLADANKWKISAQSKYDVSMTLTLVIKNNWEK